MCQCLRLLGCNKTGFNLKLYSFVSAESCLQYDAINNYSRPQEDEHGFWFDIQPVTGTTVSAKARIQINILVRYVVNVVLTTVLVYKDDTELRDLK